MDLVALRALIDSDPVNNPPATDAQVQSWLNAPVTTGRLVLVSELRTWMTTQVYGTGAGKRMLRDALHEFGSAGTVAGAAFTGTAAAARRSAARDILDMLRTADAGEGFPVDDPNVAASFLSLGSDGGNGPGLLSGAQLSAIAAAAEQSVPRWSTAVHREPELLTDIPQARAL